MCGKGGKECTVGLDRAGKCIITSKLCTLRVPALAFPLLVILSLTLAMFFTGSAGHEGKIAMKEVKGAYRGSLVGSAVCVLSVVLATAGDKAGYYVSPGATIVPLLMLLEGLSPHDAIPVSMATIVGDAAFRFAQHMRKAHPTRAHRPLVDFDTVLLLQPPVLAGVSVGAYVDKVLPPWLLVTLLLIFLLFTCGRSMASLACSHGADEADVAASQPADVELAGPAVRVMGAGALDPFVADEQDTPKRLRRLGTIVAGLCALAIARAVPSCGGMLYWLLLFFVFPATGVATFAQAQRLVEGHKNRTRNKYVYAQGDVQWDDEKAFKYVGRGVVSGVAAGTLGVGGSMFMMPQAQVMGMLPDVSAATVSAMTLATSAVATVQFWSLGLMPSLLFLIWQVLLGFVGAAAGFRFTRTLPVRAAARVGMLGAIIVGLGALALGMQQFTIVQSQGLRGLAGVCEEDF